MAKNIKDQSTKEQLLKSARTEFFEKGYEKASLRNMCTNAGLTTGALYFFFKDKRDIFNCIVTPFLEEIKNTIEMHYSNEQELADEYASILPTDNSGDIEVSINILKTMYKYREECILFLNTSEVSNEFINNIIEFSEKHYSSMFVKMTGTVDFDSYIIHWLSHMQIDAFVHLFLHEKDESKALERIPSIINFLTQGFYSYLYEVKNKNNT